jgi:hypothetical protein
MNKQIKIFDYIPELDAFNVTDEYKKLADELGLAEWNYVVWIGRLFTMDNDYGEHWFDNWTERAKIQKKAQQMGLNSDDLYIINADRFTDSKDGPSHTDVERKIFWTDVCKSLTLSLETLCTFALRWNPPVGDEDHIPYLKRKINALLKE